MARRSSVGQDLEAANTPVVGIGYLWVPHLPLSVALTNRPDLQGRQVIIGGDHNRGLVTGGGAVLDASDECLAAGVRIGRPLREAREYCPDAAFLPADPEVDHRAHEVLLELVGTVAPEVEEDGLGRAYFALDRPVGHEDGRWLLATLRALVRDRLGFRSSPSCGAVLAAGRGAHLALASNKFAARTAAERDPEAATGTPIVPAGGVVAYLAPLPVDALPLPPRALERLRTLGIATVGQFARLPRGGLARRFGAEAVEAHRLAHGEDNRPIVGRRPPETKMARRAFDPPVETLEPVLAVASQLLEQLCAGVRAEGKTFRGMGVAVEGESGGRPPVERTAALRTATSRPEDCRATLRALVEVAAGTGAVSAVSVTLSALGSAGGEQLALFEEPGTRSTGGGRPERKRRLKEATREIGRRYPARLRRVVPQRGADAPRRAPVRAAPVRAR